MFSDLGTKQVERECVPSCKGTCQIDRCWLKASKAIEPEEESSCLGVSMFLRSTGMNSWRPLITLDLSRLPKDCPLTCSGPVEVSISLENQT
jgi:hypothetical protein